MDQLDILTEAKKNDPGFSSLSIGRRNSSIPFGSRDEIQANNQKAGFDDFEDKPSFYNPLERKTSGRRSSEFKAVKQDDDLLDLLIESEKHKGVISRPTTSNLRKPQSSEGKPQNYSNTYTAGFYTGNKDEKPSSFKPPLFQNKFQLPDSFNESQFQNEKPKPNNAVNEAQNKPENDSGIQVLNLTKSRRKSTVRNPITTITEDEKRSNKESLEIKSHKTDDLKSPSELISNKPNTNNPFPVSQKLIPQSNFDSKINIENEAKVKILEQRLENEKKSNNEINDKKDKEYNLLLKNEIERLNEFHKIELERIKSGHLLEIESLQKKYEQDIISYKMQLENYVNLNNVLNDLKANSQKMLSAYEFNNANKKNESTLENQLEIKAQQRAFEEEKKKLYLEKDLFEVEKSRIREREKLLQEKENSLKVDIDNERKVIFQEIHRLNELQESIRNLEAEKRKEIIKEFENLKYEKQEFEQEKLNLYEEFEIKYKELENQILLVNGEKSQLEGLNAKVSKKIKEKLTESERIKMKLLEEENLINKKKREIELKEVETLQLYDEVKTKSMRLQMEKDAFELEVSKFNEVAKSVNAESHFIRQFKLNFDTEKEKLKKNWEDLEIYRNENIRKELELESEKKRVMELQSTLEGLRFDTVKNLQRNQRMNLNSLNTHSNVQSTQNQIRIAQKTIISEPENDYSKSNMTAHLNIADTKSKASFNALLSFNNHLKEIENDLDLNKHFFNKELSSSIH